MENNHEGKGISYQLHKIEDKHYFGGFLNLADQNIKDVFNEVVQRFGLKKQKLNKIVEELFEDNISIVDYEKKINILSDYLPIIREIDQINKQYNGESIEKTREERIKYFRDNFNNLLKTVEQLRNFYTHYHHEPILISEDVFIFLDNSLFHTVIATKKKYLKTDKTKEAISLTLREELDLLCKEKKADLIKRKVRFDRNDINSIINSIYNDAFKEFIYDSDNVSELKISRKSKINHADQPDQEFSPPISLSGIVYLLSFFLRRKEIEDFKSNLNGYKGKVIKNDTITLKKNSIMFMATHRIYSVHAYKGLKRKIRTSTKAVKETLLMQMLDELSKVPDIIYQHTSTSLQKTFIEDWNEYYKDNEENNQNSENSKVIHPVVRKRYEDKFNYFALRFLDEYAKFPSLRFQVHLGNYIHDKRNKIVGKNNLLSERIIKEKITVFARLNEINNAKHAYFEDVQNSENDELLWELFPNPSYDFPKEQSSVKNERQKNAGKIGIYLILKNPKLLAEVNNAKNSLFPAIRKNEKPTRSILIEQIISLNNDTNKDSIVYEGQPIAYLSMNDIHSIVYELLKNDESNNNLDRISEKIEKRIMDQISKQLTQISKKDTDIKILKDYRTSLDHNKVDQEKLYRDLELDHNRLITLKKEYKSNQNDLYKKERKYLFYTNEKGQIATWLANDIKRFMPKTFKQNWKGYQHSELQRNFAFYETNKNNFEFILNGLVYREIDFDLKSCFTKDNLEDFYLAYLDFRLKHITDLILRFESHKNDPKNFKKVAKECFKFLKKQNYLTSNLETKVNHLLAMPVFIERGFMDDKPTMIDGLNYNDNKDQFAEWFVFFKDQVKYQNFYNNSLYPTLLTREEIEHIAVSTHEDKSKYRLEQTIQKKIQQQQKNDVFTLLIAKYIFNDLFKQKFELNLDELFQTKSEREMNIQKSIETQERNLNFIWNKTIDIELLDGKIKINNVKLKDIGNFRKYETDQRIKTFLEYEPQISWLAYLPNERNENEILVNIIEDQVDVFEKVRNHNLLKEVQLLEGNIFKNTEDKKILQEKSNENFKNYILNGLIGTDITHSFLYFKKELNYQELYEKGNQIEQLAFILINIRNKFAHNKLPEKEFFDFCQTLLPIESNQYYATYYLIIFKLAKEKIEIEIKKALNKSNSEDY